MKISHVVATNLAAVLSAATLFAHSGKTHIEGTVTAIDAKRIAVNEGNGKSISIRVNRDTVYQRQGYRTPAAPAELKVGDRVFIESFGMPGGEQAALEIHFAPPIEVGQPKEAGHPQVE